MPIVIVTARNDEVDRITGLEARRRRRRGPAPKEVVARVRAVLRRAEAQPASHERIVAGDLELDLARRRVTAAGHRVPLTPTEFGLLATLAREPGSVWTRSQLLDAVHGFSLESYERAIDGHVRNLRRKLEAAASGRSYVRTVHGVGYALEEPAGADPGPERAAGAATDGSGTSRTSGAARVAGRIRCGRAPGRPPGATGAGAGRRRVHRLPLVALIVFVGVVTALATWVAAILLGVLSPGAAPPMATAVAIVVVLVVVVILGGRVVFAAVRPLADVAAASERLADGEPGVRVTPRGPVPVRRWGVQRHGRAPRPIA